MYHSITVLGNLGSDPQLKTFPDGGSVANFSLAANKRHKDQSGAWVEQVVWFKVSAWGAQANAIAQYLKKGRSVLVVGELKPDVNTGNPRMWASQDGTVNASYDLNAHQVKFISTGEGGGGGQRASGGQQASAPTEQDEIPF